MPVQHSVYLEAPVNSSTNQDFYYIFQDFPRGMGTLCKLYN